MKRFLFLVVVLTGAAGAWLWWQRRLDAQQQDVWSQVMTPEPEPPAIEATPAPKKAARKSAPAKSAAKKSAPTS